MERCRKKGFTLVEILVTLAMMGAIMAALYGSYQAVVRVREALGPSCNQTQRVVWTLERISRSLRGAYRKSSEIKAAPIINDVNDGLLPPGNFVGASSTKRSDLSFVCVMVSSDTEGCTLQRVYLRWIRAERSLQMATTAAFFLPEQDIEETLDWQIMLDTADVFEIAFLKQDQWFDAWPQEDSEALPEAIKMSVTVQVENDRSKCWTTTVSPALSRPVDRIEESI